MAVAAAVAVAVATDVDNAVAVAIAAAMAGAAALAVAVHFLQDSLSENSVLRFRVLSVWGEQFFFNIFIFMPDLACY